MTYRNGKIKKMIALGLFLILACVFIYVVFIEHGLITVDRQTIRTSHISSKADGLKIVQIADTHLGFGQNINNLRKAVAKINEMDCDIVVFCGDLFDNYAANATDAAEATQLLKSIQARLGKFAVFGNRDYGGKAEHAYEQIMKQADFTLLKNEAHYFAQQNVNIIGTDDFIFGQNPGVIAAADWRTDAFNVLLCHEPDPVSRFTDKPLDLQLSGHSHGGQIQLPFYGPLILPRMGKLYYDGLYTIKERERPLLLYVNRGLGTTGVNLRFNAPPEITLITLQKTE